MNKIRNLDQFYTNPKISNKLVDIVKMNIKKFEKKKFIEPSAGSGNFIDSLVDKGIKNKNILAYDIEPKHEMIKKTDYLQKRIKFSKKNLIIGNPPFGKRSKLAIQFVNKGLKEGTNVAMILPRQFNRYLTQKQIDKRAKLIYSENIEKDAFLVNDRRYNVNCVFQIWSIDKNEKNLRIINPEPRIHEDFETKIHNNTKLTLKYFSKKNFNWNYAVHRQGFYKYNELIKKENDLVKNRQYFFIKVNNEIAHDIIKKIDFKKLSKTNTQIPGYSTTDFVKEYKELKKNNDITKFTYIYKK